MQFTVRTIMIVTTLFAVLLVIPGGWLAFVLNIVWVMLPAMLVTLAVYGASRDRAFSLGGLATYFAMTLTPSWQPFRMGGFVQILIIACSGACSVLLQRKLQRSANQGT